jgi:CRP-like cAMP-binding protein
VPRPLERLTGLRAGDLRDALPFFALQAGIAAYWAVAASAGDALLLSRLRARALPVEAVVPWTYLAVAGASGAALAGFDALQARLPRRALFVGVPLALAASIAGFRALLGLETVWIRFALSVWLEVAALVSMTLAFALAGDRFRSREAKRVYGFIGGGFCVGLAAGGAAAVRLTARIGAGDLLLVATALMTVNAAVSARVARSARPPRGAVEPGAPPPPLRAVTADPYLRRLAAAVFLGAALFVLVDFQLKSLASGLPQDQIAVFFGRLYGWAGAGEAAVEFFLLGALIRRAGVLNAQLLYPGLMAAGSAATLWAPGLGSAAGVNLARMISAESVERPTRELLLLPLAERLRARAQALIDGPVVSLGQAAAAVAILAMGAAAAGPRVLPAAALAVAVLAFLPLIRLRPLYRGLLARAIRSRPLETVDLARLAREPGARETLAELLASSDPREARFARAVLERAGGRPSPPSEDPDPGRLSDPAATDARRCAAAVEAGRRGGADSGRALWALPPAAGAALAAAAARAALEIQRRGAWEGPPPAELERRRAFEAEALLTLARARREAGADPRLSVLLEDFAKVRSELLLALHALNGGPAALDGVRRDLWSPDAASRAAALELAEELLPARAAAALSAWVDDPARESPARPGPETRAAIAAFDPGLARLFDGGADAARAACLRGLGLLSGLETPYILQLLEASRERRLTPGEFLFREGDRGRELVLIEEGEVAIESKGRTIASLGSGECVGELSVLDGLPRSADGRAAKPCRVIAIEQDAFRAVVSGRPAAGLSLLRVLERRLRAALPPSPEPARAAPAARPGPDGADAGARARLLTAAALRKAPLLDGLPDAALAAVAGLARPVPVFAGETLFEQGERGAALYLIATGRLSVEAGGSRLAGLGPGGVVGELALISGLGRTAAVRVESDGLLLSVEAADFERLLREEPAVLWSLLETLAGRLRASLSGPASGLRH